jgi:hypothetical protein
MTTPMSDNPLTDEAMEQAFPVRRRGLGKETLMAGGKEPLIVRPGRIPGCDCTCEVDRRHNADCLWYPQVVGAEVPRTRAQEATCCT